MFQPKMSSSHISSFIYWQIMKPHLSILTNKNPLRAIKNNNIYGLDGFMDELWWNMANENITILVLLVLSAAVSAVNHSTSGPLSGTAKPSWWLHKGDVGPFYCSALRKAFLNFSAWIYLPITSNYYFKSCTLESPSSVWHAFRYLKSCPPVFSLQG